MLRFRRVGAACVAGVHFLTNGLAAHAVEKSLWEERRLALERAPVDARFLARTQGPLVWKNTAFDGGSTTSQPPSTFLKRLAVPFDVASTVLPYGAIGEVRPGRPGAPVVFLVQDVHGNTGAQKNIGGLLGDLSARGVTLTGVEGAWVPIDLAAFHRHPSPEAVSLVSDALLAAGRLSGAEWAGLTAPHPPSLVGVESPALYRANVAAARTCVARRPAVETFLAGLNTALQTQKDRYYSPELKSLDYHINEYHEGREALAAHVRFLSGLSRSGIEPGAQVKIFIKAMDWESRLNFEKVEADRRTLMDRLARNLGRRDLDELLSQAVAYRGGKETNGDFFSYFKTLCAKSHTPLASYQSFADYISYVGVVQSINRADLLSEITAWQTELAARLARTPEERRLVAVAGDASLLRQLLENEMSPESWVQFNKRRNDIISLPARLKLPQGDLAAFFRSHEDFCRLATERNGALVSNFMRQVESSKAARAVLVTGGFHTPGLQSELLKRGCSTVVITPRIEKVEGKPLDVFARDPLPFDQLFAGKPISLSPVLMMGQPEGKRFFNLLVEAERRFRGLVYATGRTDGSHSNGIRGGHTFPSAVRRFPLMNGAVLLIGPSSSVLEKNESTMSKVWTLRLSNGDAIALLVPTPRVERRGMVRRFLNYLIPVHFFVPHVLPSGTSASAKTWTPFWQLGKRSMATEGVYNDSINGFFESFYKKLGKDSVILDLGGGAGYLGNLALKISPNFYVVELDIADIPKKSQFPGLNYVRANAEGIPFPSETFDGVVDSFSLAYANIPKVIHELFRVMKPGAKAAILLHSPNSDLVRGAKRTNEDLRQLGWDESILDKLEEYLQSGISKSRKKQLNLEFTQLMRNYIENDDMEGGRRSNPATGPLDVLTNLLVYGGDRTLHLVEIYRVSFSVWHSLFEAASKVPSEKGEVANLFSRAGFNVDHLEISHHGWKIQISKPVRLINTPPLFHIDRSGLSVRVRLTDSSGKEVASATVGGKRGAIEIRNFTVQDGGATYAYAYELVAGVVKEFLLLKGQGLILVCAVEDPQIKKAVKALFGDNFTLAPKGFGRFLNGPWTDALDPSSEEFNRLMDDPTAVVDMAGSVTQTARQSLWPNETLPSPVVGVPSPREPIVAFIKSNDPGKIFENIGLGVRENYIYDVQIGGRVVGTAIFSETNKSLWMRDLFIREEYRNQGYGKVVYRELAKRSALILNPELNRRGDPVPFKGMNIENPFAFKIIGGLYNEDSVEVVGVGTMASDENFDSVTDWANALANGSEGFISLVGPANIDKEGPNEGKYRIHFDFRGMPNQNVAEEAEREFLERLAVPASNRSASANGFAFIGGGALLDPISGVVLGAMLVVAMLYKDKIMDWLGNNELLWLSSFIDLAIPSLAKHRPAIGRFFAQALMAGVNFVGRLFGMSFLGMSHQLYVVPQNNEGERVRIASNQREIPGALISVRSVGEDLTSENRSEIAEILTKLTPPVQYLRGADIFINPEINPGLGSPANRSKNLELTDISIDSLTREVLNRLTEAKAEDVSWALGLLGRRNGQHALKQALDCAVVGSNAPLAGTIFAVLNDSRLNLGVRVDDLAEVLSLLSKGERLSESIAGNFADGFNRMQSALIHQRYLGAHLAGEGIVLDMTELFKPNLSPEAADEIQIAIAGSLNAARGDNQKRLALVVRNESVSRSAVEEAMRKFLPSWGKDELNGTTLILASEDKSKKFFVEGKFVLGELRKYRKWAGLLRLVGFSSETLVGTGEDIKNAELIPFSAPIFRELGENLRKLKFIRVSA